MHVQCRLKPHLPEHTRTPTVLDRIRLNSPDIDTLLLSAIIPCIRKKTGATATQRATFPIFEQLPTGGSRVAVTSAHEDCRTPTSSHEHSRRRSYVLARFVSSRARTQPTLEKFVYQANSSTAGVFIGSFTLRVCLSSRESSLPDFLLCQPYRLVQTIRRAFSVVNRHDVANPPCSK